jgi:geranylgeranyl diphosphate synthase type I
LNLQRSMEKFLPLIEDELRACVAAPDDSHPAFLGMMHYHLGWTDDQFRPVQLKAGKRLRPLFTLLACQAAGGDPHHALPAAAAVEIIHNFSLIHDDIEDQSHTRRGRSTVWSVWGEAQAINAGDAMFALAHLALHRLALHGVPSDRLALAFRALDETCVTLCRGQHMDMAFEDRLDVDTDAYMSMIRGKTAALLGCAGHLGALTATSDTTQADRYRRVGEGLGMAFQIQDDVLGIWGETEVTGKPVADDLRYRKKTLPVVYVLGRPNDVRAERLRAIYAQSSLSEEDVAEAVAILDAGQSQSRAQALARDFLEEALSELGQAEPEPGAAEALRELAHFLVNRSA